MSDLIDFESPNTKNIALLLPSPLIPAPENLKNDGFNSNEAGSHNGEAEKCRSTENNPFDIVMKKIIDYERNKEDPFETVIEKANECTIKIPESCDNYSTQNTKYLDIVKTNNALKETEINIDTPLLKGENDMSIITDLNNTNLISDSINENEIISTLSCDNNIPNIYISPTSYNKDLSLLNNSSMNDSLMDHDGDLTKEIKNIPTDFSTYFKSMSQNCCKQNKNFLGIQNKRSMSMSDTLKSNMFGEDYLLNSAHSSIFEDPFNKAFRKNSLRSTVSYNSSYLSNQFDLSLSKQNLDRRISNSSVFSGLSNISVIPTDPVLKIRHNRFCSESSIFSGISNVSTISTNNFISSSDSSVFSNDTLNKGFINSQTQPIDSTNSTTDPNPVNACDKSDLIRKFFEIKTRMSTAEIEKPKIEDNEQIQINHSCTKYDSQIEKKENYDEKLIDIDSSFNSVFNDETEVNEIILNEARLLAETFEKMASSKESTSITEDDLLSKIKLNFDYLPKSDDETVDNLIDLPTSPLKNTLLSKVDTSTEKHVESNVISLQDNIKALENEFIEKKSYNKKATTATLLLDLEKLIKEENNPDAYKVLNELQKLLGIEYDNNAEILQLYLQNTDNSQNKNSDELHFSRNIDNSNYESNTSKQNIISDRESHSYNLKENIENKQNNINNSNLKLNIVNELKEKMIDSKNKINEFQHSKKKKDRKKEKRKENDTSEDQNLTKILITSLKKIINEKNENSAVDILRSLGTALNMVTELQTKNDDKPNSDIKKNKKSLPIELHHLSNSFNKSSSINVDIKNRSFEVLPVQKSISINSPNKNRNLLDSSFTKDKRRSHLLNLKKRFSSDPGYKRPVMEINGNEETVEQRFNFKTSATTTKQLKTKFKKKFNSDIVTKKGPLKAIIPLDNMEKRGSINKKMSLNNVTPPKPIDIVPTLNIVSSTPNTNEINKNCKSEPTASSTPNIEGLRMQRTIVQKSLTLNSKSTLISNVSSALLSFNTKEPVGLSVNCNKRMQRTLSPQKRSFTPKKTFESSLESRLPRYSPRPIRVRNYSFDDLKTAKSLQTMSNVPKFSSEKKLNRPIILSPLKNCNKVKHKEKFVSRLGKSSNMQSDSEKENYA